MSITELQILLDLNYGNELDVLDKHASLTDYGYLFVDSENGHCYLFDQNGKMDDIKKITTLCEKYVKKDIKNIAIPESVKSIGDGAFEDYLFLTSIEIPESVKSIGYWTFANCISLKSIKIPESVENIGDGAFLNCKSLKSIEIPESIKSIGDWAFQDCTSLKSIKIPESVKSIGKWAFEDCISLKEVIFKGKTIGQVKAMDWYPWGIKDEAIIKCS